MDFPIDRFGLVRRQAVLAAGLSDDDFTAAIRRGELIRLVAGIAVTPSERFDGAAGAQALHRLKAIAVATSERIVDDPLPLSHGSAAALHRLPLLKPNLVRVHVTSGRPGGGSLRAQRHVHGAPLTADEVTVVDGITVTSLERTAVDVATAGTFAQALTVFDQALRAGAAPALLEASLNSHRRNGIRTARRAFGYATPLSESVGESWSRAQMIDARLPLPRLQHRAPGTSSTFLVDFDWDWLLVGEFDGLVKYRAGTRRPGESVEDAVIREKLREDAIRRTGPFVVRWTWRDLENGTLPALLRPHLVRLGLMAQPA